jgi:hypothetical protein
MGLDSREVTPELTRAVVCLAAEVRSFERAEVTTEHVLGHKVSRSTIRRLAKQVGLELAAREEPSEESAGQEVVVPAAAVVSCDGGRIRTRAPGEGRGVVLSGEKGWRETKNASFERMSLNKRHVANEDACPELPTSFRSARKVANIAEKAVPQLDAPGEESAVEKPRRVKYEGPQRVLRTALSSMACSEDFGPLMQREAQRRRFYDSPLRVFLGDGLNWNWSIWKKYFATFTPVLDFIHAIQYVFCAAMSMTASVAEGWSLYLKLVTWCWQGQVEQVIAEFQAACRARGIDWTNTKPSEVEKPLVDAVRYLTNNRQRMDYPRYRRLGLPVTSAPMESLIKQMNLRVKGTEMFWDDPDGAEAILQLRAAALSDDGRLKDYLARRPGYPFHRRPTPLATAA